MHSHLSTVQRLSAPAASACVVSGLSSSWHCVGITYPFANSSNSQSYLCIGRTLGRQFPSETLSSFHPAAPLVSILPGLDVTPPITGESDSSLMHAAAAAAEMFVRWKLWKHACLFFPPPDWHWWWLMFSCMWAVIKFLHRQTDELCGVCQDYLRANTLWAALSFKCHIFHLILIKKSCALTETFLGEQWFTCKRLYSLSQYAFVLTSSKEMEHSYFYQLKTSNSVTKTQRQGVTH